MPSIPVRDGRLLAWAEFGDPAGRPLLVFHGLPGSRLQAGLLHEQALAAHVRLVAPERPGFGHSSPAPRRAIRDWPGDVACLADRLDLARFGVLGISCGGPYALACAHALPDRVNYAGLLGGMGPMDLPALRHEQARALKVLFGLARIHPRLAALPLLADAWLLRNRPERAIAALAPLLSPPDRSLLAADATVRERLAASLAEAYRQGVGGAMTEAALIARPRGFALEDIRVPVHVYQGGLDRHVPPAMGRHIAKTVPGGRLHFYDGEGHLSIVLNRFADCVAHFRGEAD